MSNKTESRIEDLEHDLTTRWESDRGYYIDELQVNNLQKYKDLVKQQARDEIRERLDIDEVKHIYKLSLDKGDIVPCVCNWNTFIDVLSEELFGEGEK